MLVENGTGNAIKCSTVIIFFHEMKRKFDEMNLKFKSMVYRFQEKFSSNEISIKGIKNYLASCHPDCTSQLAMLDNMSDIIELAKKKCDIMSIQPLEDMAETFEVTDAIQIVQGYKETVDSFLKSILDVLQVDDDKIQMTNKGRLKAVFVLGWNSQDICDIVRLENIHIENGHSQTGQPIVTCHCPVVSIVLLIALVLEKIEILQQKGLKEFLVGKRTVWDSTVNEVML